MTRRQQILSAAFDKAIKDPLPPIDAFIAGAEWADANPNVMKAQVMKNQSKVLKRLAGK